jgi:TPR repeat protein
MCIGAAVAMLLFVPAYGSAQDPVTVSCGDLYSRSPLEELRRCADQGDAGTQFALGLKYASGAGVPEDDVEAVRWYRLAAEQEYAEAQWLLGIMYGEGHGVPEDDVLAYMWFDLSGAQGHVSAQESKDIIEQLMSRAQIAEAQRLSREWRESRASPDEDLHDLDGGGAGVVEAVSRALLEEVRVPRLDDHGRPSFQVELHRA